MPWRKCGRIFQAPGAPDWLSSHAALPVTDLAPGGSVTVYFSSRDGQGRARIGRFDFDPNRPAQSVALRPEPVVEIGSLGAFDDRGVTSSCLVSFEDRKYLYYSGWSLGVTVPFYIFIGLAVSSDAGATFRKVSEAPVLGRDKTDPYLTASPCILIEDGVWRMWYTSCVKWSFDENGKPKHYYHIKYAESSDGIHWSLDRPVCIDFQGPDEYAFGRPCVTKDSAGYKMWYCFRGAAYRIGYAESRDGVRWRRLDHLAGLAPSVDDWDSDMQAYPWIFTSQETSYMLYNGNDYGRTGIGMAILEPSTDSA